MGLRSPASNQVLFPLPPRSLKQESDGQNSKLNAVTKRQKDRGCVCCSVAKVKAKSLSRVRLCDPMDVAYQAPWSMGFSRQEYWSGLPFPSPGDLSNSGIEPRSPTLQADSLPSEPSGKSYQFVQVDRKLISRLQLRKYMVTYFMINDRHKMNSSEPLASLKLNTERYQIFIC